MRTEPGTQAAGSLLVRLDGDDLGSGAEERRAQRTGTGAYVEDQVAFEDAGVTDDPPRPSLSQ